MQTAPQFFRSAGPVPLAELVSGLDVTVDDPRADSAQVVGVAALDRSGSGDLAFLSGKQQLHKLAQSRATAVFVPPDMAKHVAAMGAIAVSTPFPKAHFGRVLPKLYTYDGDAPPVIHPSAEVHPTAIIGPGVRIGARTRVGAYAVVETSLVGEDCVIQSHSAIGGSGFSVDRDESGVVSMMHVGRVVMGDRVHIGAHVCIDRGFIGDTVVSDDVRIDNLVQIGHNCSIGPRTFLASFAGISGSCDIGADVRMGGRVGLADHVKVGDGATVNAGSAVMHDIPAGETWMGYPASPVRDNMRQVAALRRLARGSRPKARPKAK